MTDEFELFSESDFAEDYPKLLSRANCVKICNAKVREWLASSTNKFRFNYRKDFRGFDQICTDRMPTHEMTILCIKPIEPEDSAESLLKEMLQLEQSVTWRMPDKLVERARKLLNGVKK